jgi:hypothetical protein
MLARFPRVGHLAFAAVAQLVECVLGKDEVVGSNPTSSFRATSGPTIR